MVVRLGDSFIIDGDDDTVKSSIYLKNIENKRITILSRKGERYIKTKDKFTLIDGRGLKGRVFIHCNNCSNSIIEIVPTYLKKNRVYIEPIESKQTRNILNKKFRRINN